MIYAVLLSWRIVSFIPLAARGYLKGCTTYRTVLPALNNARPFPIPTQWKAGLRGLQGATENDSAEVWWELWWKAQWEQSTSTRLYQKPKTAHRFNISANTSRVVLVFRPFPNVKCCLQLCYVAYFWVKQDISWEKCMGWDLISSIGNWLDCAKWLLPEWNQTEWESAKTMAKIGSWLTFSKANEERSFQRNSKLLLFD